MSRGRRIVENAFGMEAEKLRVLLYPMDQTVTLACCALHNFLITEHGAYLAGLVDLNMVDTDGINNQVSNHCLLTNGNLRKKNVSRNRETFLEYFITMGKVYWQDEMI